MNSPKCNEIKTTNCRSKHKLSFIYLFNEINYNNKNELMMFSFCRCCEILFDILDSYVDSKKSRAIVWPLQILLLVLSPVKYLSSILNAFFMSHFMFALKLQKILEEIVNADSGAPCSPRHLKKKHFVDTVKKGVTSHATSKQLTESAAIACVKLCKISTYVPTTESTNVTFYLVQYVINDIKVFYLKKNRFLPFQIQITHGLCIVGITI